MDEGISVLVIFVLGILAVGIIASGSVNTPDISVEDSYIIKDKVKIIKNDGVHKRTKEMLYLDCDLEFPSDLYVEATLLDKNNRTIGKASRIIREEGKYKIVLPFRKKLNRVNYTIYAGSNDQLKPLYNGSVTKIVKQSHTYNRTIYKKKNKTKASTKSSTSSYSNSLSDSSSSGSSYSSYSSGGSGSSSYSSYSSSSDSGNSYASEEVTGGSYVASKNSDKFHHYYCGHAKRIKSKNRIYFSSRQEALNSGYDPCKSCDP